MISTKMSSKKIKKQISGIPIILNEFKNYLEKKEHNKTEEQEMKNDQNTKDAKVKKIFQIFKNYD